MYNLHQCRILMQIKAPEKCWNLNEQMFSWVLYLYSVLSDVSPSFFSCPPPHSCLFYPGGRINFCQGRGGRKDCRGGQKIYFRPCNSNIHYMYISKSISIMVQFEGPCHTHTHISWGFFKDNTLYMYTLQT